MRILVIGSGGREHALTDKLAQSPKVAKIFCAPGNSGTAQKAENAPLKPDDIKGLVKFAVDNRIDLVVPGPELPLTLGITDAMRKAGIDCFGPDEFCARLEGSKSFAKEIMVKAQVPTAACQVFTDPAMAREYILKAPSLLVVKADGLAAGKGVTVCSTRQEALDAAQEMLADKRFGNAGATIVIEERLEGEEVSLLCFCDGETALPLPSAQDHKAVGDGDAGPNTGGMGAYSPAPVAPDDKLEELADIVIRPILKELASRGHPFKGILYAGLMMTENGPKVLEYNVRFGDPECQPLLMRLKDDLAELCMAAVQGQLKNRKISIDPRPALGVVLCASGYPGNYQKGSLVTGLEKAEEVPDTRVFQAGMKKTDAGLVSDGGRVLCAAALGESLAMAQTKAYEAIGRIHMKGGFYRHDIGAKGLKREQAAYMK